MTSLTTMTTTSALMPMPGDEYTAASPIPQPPRLAPSRAKPWAAMAAFVISVSLLGGIAVGLTTPASTAMSAAEPA
ncbi:hypothetical protein [Piscinibacter sp. XHJ-5]|uniref:hypothetical protein n=1 Tax=Piscinibacter sp. XHJ-5 TaxID=3037797 RepID=UPI0024537074|nr:hypothetical protein [Piscinibacter sp. XHJ-5]